MATPVSGTAWSRVPLPRSVSLRLLGGSDARAAFPSPGVFPACCRTWRSSRQYMFPATPTVPPHPERGVPGDSCHRADGAGDAVALTGRDGPPPAGRDPGCSPSPPAWLPAQGSPGRPPRSLRERGARPPGRPLPTGRLRTPGRRERDRWENTFPGRSARSPASEAPQPSGPAPLPGLSSPRRPPCPPPPLPAYLRLPKSARTACACALLPARPRCACVRAFIRLCERERAAGRGSAAGRERTVGGAQGRGSTAPPGGVRAPATPPVTPPVTPQSRPSHAPAAPRLSAPTGAYVGARLSLGRGSSPTHSFRPNRGIGICISVRALSRPARPFSPCCPGDTVLEDREARPSSSGLCPGAGRGTE